MWSILFILSCGEKFLDIGLYENDREYMQRFNSFIGFGLLFISFTYIFFQKHLYLNIKHRIFHVNWLVRWISYYKYLFSFKLNFCYKFKGRKNKWNRIQLKCLVWFFTLEQSIFFFVRSSTNKSSYMKNCWRSIHKIGLIMNRKSKDSFNVLIKLFQIYTVKYFNSITLV